jgi:hypothetical protein
MACFWVLGAGCWVLGAGCWVLGVVVFTASANNAAELNGAAKLVNKFRKGEKRC